MVLVPRLFWLYLTLLLALLLVVMPLPAEVRMFRPDWPLLVLAYWALALPQRVSIGTAFTLGFIVDVMVGTVLGVNSAGYAVFIYIISANHLKIRNFSILQQSLLLGLLLLLYHFIIFGLSHFLTGVYFRAAYLWPVLSGMLVWPYIFLFLRRFRRQLKIQ
jgi:rod shape-determining protein MreD